MNRQQFSDEEVQFLNVLEKAWKELPPVLGQFLIADCDHLACEEPVVDERIEEMYERLWAIHLRNTAMQEIIAIHEQWSESLGVLRDLLSQQRQRLRTTFQEIYHSRLLTSVKTAAHHVEENYRKTKRLFRNYGGSAVVLMVLAWVVAATVEIGIRQGAHQRLLLSALNSASLILAILAVVLVSVPVIVALSGLPLAVWVFLRIELPSEDRPLRQGR